jgi:hypothetical protein
MLLLLFWGKRGWLLLLFCGKRVLLDDLLTRVIEKEPVDWRYYIGDEAYVTIKAPYVCVHIRKHFIPAV